MSIHYVYVFVHILYFSVTVKSSKNKIEGPGKRQKTNTTATSGKKPASTSSSLTSLSSSSLQDLQTQPLGIPVQMIPIQKPEFTIQHQIPQGMISIQIPANILSHFRQQTPFDIRLPMGNLTTTQNSGQWFGATRMAVSNMIRMPNLVNILSSSSPQPVLNLKRMPSPSFQQQNPVGPRFVLLPCSISKSVPTCSTGNTNMVPLQPVKQQAVSQINKSEPSGNDLNNNTMSKPVEIEENKSRSSGANTPVKQTIDNKSDINNNLDLAFIEDSNDTDLTQDDKHFAMETEPSSVPKCFDFANTEENSLSEDSFVAMETSTQQSLSNKSKPLQKKNISYIF